MQQTRERVNGERVCEPWYAQVNPAKVYSCGSQLDYHPGRINGMGRVNGRGTILQLGRHPCLRPVPCGSHRNETVVVAVIDTRHERDHIIINEQP